jgi:hypothetical protein
MQQMQMRSIASVLGIMTLSLFLAGCSSRMPQPIEITTKPINKPELVLPNASELNMREVKWVLITPDNYEKVFAELGKDGRPVVLFGLTDNGYENLGLNLSDLRAYIQQQQAIMAAYEAYYKSAEEALTDAVTIN